MPDAADLFPEIPLEHNGKTYILTRPNFKTEGAYRVYLENEARKYLELTRTGSTEEHAASLAKLAKDAAIKTYGWGAADWAKSLDAHENRGHLLYLILGQVKENKITEELAHEIYRAHKAELNGVGENVGIMFGLINPPQMPPAVA